MHLCQNHMGKYSVCGSFTKKSKGFRKLKKLMTLNFYTNFYGYERGLASIVYKFFVKSRKLWVNGSSRHCVHCVH